MAVWFSCIDVCCRGILVIMVAKELVHFRRYWQELTDNIRIAKQIEIVKRQADVIKDQPLLPKKVFSPVNGNIAYLWD